MPSRRTACDIFLNNLQSQRSNESSSSSFVRSFVRKGDPFAFLTSLIDNVLIGLNGFASFRCIIGILEFLAKVISDVVIGCRTCIFNVWAYLSRNANDINPFVHPRLPRAKHAKVTRRARGQFSPAHDWTLALFSFFQRSTQMLIMVGCSLIRREHHVKTGPPPAVSFQTPHSLQKKNTIQVDCHCGPLQPPSSDYNFGNQ